MNRYEYKYEVVRKKKAYARKMMGLPKSVEVKHKDMPEWQRKHRLYLEICEQILICEELACPLSKEMIMELCEMETISQIQRYCRKVKIA